MGAKTLWGRSITETRRNNINSLVVNTEPTIPVVPPLPDGVLLYNGITITLNDQLITIGN